MGQAVLNTMTKVSASASFGLSPPPSGARLLEAIDVAGKSSVLLSSPPPGPGIMMGPVSEQPAASAPVRRTPANPSATCLIMTFPPGWRRPGIVAALADGRWRATQCILVVLASGGPMPVDLSVSTDAEPSSWGPASAVDGFLKRLGV